MNFTVVRDARELYPKGQFELAACSATWRVEGRAVVNNVEALQRVRNHKDGGARVGNAITCCSDACGTQLLATTMHPAERAVQFCSNEFQSFNGQR